MSEPIAYLNGQLLPASQATLPIDDAGFVMGATVTEQLRTFGGRLFRLERHLERLRHSLDICGLDSGLSSADFGQIAEKLVARNHPLLAQGDDLGLAIFITPGPYPALAESRNHIATVGLHTFPLAFRLWAKCYTEGLSLVTTSILQVPSHCWPAELKCRSRMHYFLADKEATTKEPGARAVLLDAAGHVTETSTANILLYVSGVGLISPPRTSVLPGVSLEFVIEMARGLNLSIIEREILPDDVATADEVLLSSTPNCLLPVTRFDGRAIGSGKRGSVFGRLLTAWGETVGLDIAGQAVCFANR
ncbi:MAG TPA: aminotransferase class IV [Pirellulales bacterium]|jgi:branched-subunit amino acid aminotransferase/4-amino-4-deoxychorismate lyase|nr:aminotransferase class IV [Pirellulales bacterium]